MPGWSVLAWTRDRASALFPVLASCIFPGRYLPRICPAGCPCRHFLYRGVRHFRRLAVSCPARRVSRPRRWRCWCRCPRRWPSGFRHGVMPGGMFITACFSAGQPWKKWNICAIAMNMNAVCVKFNAAREAARRAGAPALAETAPPARGWTRALGTDPDSG